MGTEVGDALHAEAEVQLVFSPVATFSPRARSSFRQVVARGREGGAAVASVLVASGRENGSKRPAEGAAVGQRGEQKDTFVGSVRRDVAGDADVGFDPPQLVGIHLVEASRVAGVESGVARLEIGFERGVSEGAAVGDVGVRAVGTIEEGAQRGDVHQQRLRAEGMCARLTVFAAQAGLVDVGQRVGRRSAATGQGKAPTSGVVARDIEGENHLGAERIPLESVDQRVGFEVGVDAVSGGNHGGIVGKVGQGIGVAGIVRPGEGGVLPTWGRRFVFLAGGGEERGEQCEEEGGDEVSHAGWELKRWRVICQS